MILVVVARRLQQLRCLTRLHPWRRLVFRLLHRVVRCRLRLRQVLMVGRRLRVTNIQLMVAQRLVLVLRVRRLRRW